MVLTMADVAGILAGAVVGLIMGLTGAGGGILAVPTLVYSQGWSMQQAMPVALLAVTCSALLGAIEGWRKHLVRYRAAVLMAIAGSLPTMLGVVVAHQLSQKWLMAAFSLILVFVALRLFLQKQAREASDGSRKTMARIDAQTGRFEWTLKTGSVIALIGAFAGFLTGLLGVGGGFVIVPMLRRYTNVTIQGAVATSLLVISLVGVVGVGSALMRGAQLPLVFSTLFIATTTAGMLIARRIAAHLPGLVVQRIFAAVLLIVAMSLLVRAWQSV